MIPIYSHLYLLKQLLLKIANSSQYSLVRMSVFNTYKLCCVAKTILVPYIATIFRCDQRSQHLLPHKDANNYQSHHSSLWAKDPAFGLLLAAYGWFCLLWPNKTTIEESHWSHNQASNQLHWFQLVSRTINYELCR